MGVLGGVLGGSLLGIGMSSMNKTKLPSYSYPTDALSSAEAAKPVAPETPSSVESENSNALMEAEREKERQQAALRQQQAREVHTSGLGAAGMADTSKKSLLGG